MGARSRAGGPHHLDLAGGVAHSFGIQSRPTRHRMRQFGDPIAGRDMGDIVADRRDDARRIDARDQRQRDAALALAHGDV